MDSCVILKYITLGHVVEGAQWTKVHLISSCMLVHPKDPVPLDQ